MGTAGGEGSGAGEPVGGEAGATGTPGAMGRGGGASPGAEASRTGAPGGTLPPPEDDDIVARQLREAAEKETDPELKKKLWEEYWRYKKGQR